jgi:hypothetical protein
LSTPTLIKAALDRILLSARMLLRMRTNGPGRY